MFQWESCISLGVLLILLVLLALQLLLGLLLLQPLLLQVLQPSLLLSEVLLMLCLDQCLQKFINKTLQGGKRLLFNSDPWPPAEQKLEMPCDNIALLFTFKCHIYESNLIYYYAFRQKLNLVSKSYRNVIWFQQRTCKPFPRHQI